ncbi:unnamed protein product [Nezara viridula]|uniref:Uncharacterized protein n=1 Tax=Nezara viridula TaxID=85310 RepID=A0A9P0HMB4_NEZVI|nr:unnamed protein product [Nezara viridula]
MPRDPFELVGGDRRSGLIARVLRPPRVALESEVHGYLDSTTIYSTNYPSPISVVIKEVLRPFCLVVLLRTGQDGDRLWLDKKKDGCRGGANWSSVGVNEPTCDLLPQMGVPLGTGLPQVSQADCCNSYFGGRNRSAIISSERILMNKHLVAAVIKGTEQKLAQMAPRWSTCSNPSG